MVQVHDGNKVPVFLDAWHPDDTEKVWIAWDDVLNGATISSSAWTYPTGWTSSGTQSDTSVVDYSVSPAVTYTSANSTTLSTTNTKGTHRITNTVVLSDGRTLSRSVDIVVNMV